MYANRGVAAYGHARSRGKYAGAGLRARELRPGVGNADIACTPASHTGHFRHRAGTMCRSAHLAATLSDSAGSAWVSRGVARRAPTWIWSAAGIGIYGLSPDAALPGAGDLVPALSWRTMVTYVKRVEAGEGVGVGDEVVLIGRQGSHVVTVEELAGLAGTIADEILCGISTRVPHRYSA